MVAMTRDQARQAFGSGTMGILVDSSSGLPGLRRSAGEQLALRVAPLPIPHPSGRLPAGGAAAMILTRDAAKREAAWRYVSFAAGPIGQSLLVPGTGYMTSNRIALEDPALLGRYYDANPIERVAADQAARLGPWFAFRGDNSLKISVAIRGFLEEVATQRRTPAAALPAMTAAVQELLAS
jgi:multiple sugar transport system substrate-binding protein